MLSIGLKVLKQSGIMDAYQYLLTQLCQYGLPTGDLYEFSALTVLRYEKKMKQKKKKDLEMRLKERQENKNVVTKIPALMAHEIEEIKMAESPPKAKIRRPAPKTKAIASTPAEQE
jgi:ribosomal protein S8